MNSGSHGTSPRSRAVLAACAMLFIAAATPAAVAAEAPEPSAVSAENGRRIAPDAPEWRELARRLAEQPDTVASFEERRQFPFRKQPIVLGGEVRVSRRHGLSLRYTTPEERVVVLDEKGMLIRDASGQSVPPDPRAAPVNRALLHILRLDLAALAESFELHGQCDAEVWALVLVPRDEATRRAIGNIHVSGDAGVVRAIELRRGAQQRIEIAIAAPRTVDRFSSEDVKRFFR
jgi:hypothetical protein